ncbi:MAG: hypothetical protein ACI9DF_001063 [Verrucomicrobiales bacterium]|jgi:hypothetical protein
MIMRALAITLLFATASVADAQEPVISEIMASNQRSFVDGHGEYPDWIEIHNPTDNDIDLQGYVLRDCDTDWPMSSTSLGPDDRMLVFASGNGGFDPDGWPHATFTLSKEGEPLELINPAGEVVSSFGDGFPEQRTDISYGLDPDGNFAYFTSPTPRAPNGSGILGFVADTKFSTKRGHYSKAFELVITTETEGASIVYTTDGRDPREGNLFSPTRIYEGPITIDRTTTIRAFAKKADFVSTNIDTQTYIFTNDVIRQTNEPAGFPNTWGEFTGTNGSVRGRPVPADYEMNPAIVDDDPDAMETALKSLPTLSIVMDPSDLFGRDGILANPFGGVDGSGVHTMAPFIKDRQTSVEWIDPNGGPEMQIDCGIRLSGGWSRHYAATPKKSFSLVFKEIFGPSKLRFPMFPGSSVDEFDRVVLKAIFSNAWPDAARPPDYLRDYFTRQTRLDMGEPASHGSWVHLYLNGLYWGLYNPTERPDASYAATHFGGEKAEYDAVKHAGLGGPGQATNDRHEVIDGTEDKWLAALSLARDGLENEANYRAFQELVDVQNLADYAILNIYGANVDWPHKNWYANTKREGGAGFRFYSWDSEYAWHDLAADRINVSNRNTPAELYASVRRNKDFQRLFGDRVQKHLFGDGALTVEANVARFNRLAAIIEPAITAEAARWGDHANTRQGRTNYTKASWESARNGIINNFLTKRHDRAVEQFLAADLYLDLIAPTFEPHGGEVEADHRLVLRSKDAQNLLLPNGGDIVFTLDGTDPRLPDNTKSPTALTYARGHQLTESVTIKTRLLKKNIFTGGSWSALSEARFIVGTVAADRTNFVISKIHYRPGAPTPAEIDAGHSSRSDFEYLEFFNPSGVRIHLSGMQLTRGVDYQFPDGYEVGAGQRALLVSNRAAFESRHGSGLSIVGEFEGKLSDGGETISLTDQDGQTLWELAYDDDAPWPEDADGGGAALVLSNTNADPTDTAQWGSIPDGGQPGSDPAAGDDPLTTWMHERGVTELTSADLLTFALAQDLLSATASLSVMSLDNETLTLSYPRRINAGRVSYAVQASHDLTQWSAVTAIATETPSGDETLAVHLELSQAMGSYFRLAVQVIP